MNFYLICPHKNKTEGVKLHDRGNQLIEPFREMTLTQKFDLCRSIILKIGLS